MNYQKTAVIVRDAQMYREVVALLTKGGCNTDNIGPSRGLFVITSGPKSGRVDYLARNHPCVYTCIKKALDKGYDIVMGEDFLANPKLLTVWKKPVALKTIMVNGNEVSEATVIAGLEALLANIKK